MKIDMRMMLVSVSCAALAACGGGGSDQAAAPDAAPAATTAAAGAAPAPAAAPAADNTETLDGTKLADFTPDAARGQTVFIQCQTCHVREDGVNRIGPSLYGIVGRAAGQVAGYDYTPANANSGITWTPEKMFQYLENPQRVVPGTRMAFGGLASGQDRADLIAFLQTEP